MEDFKVSYRPEEAARAIGISRAKLYQALAAGRLKARKFDSCTLILKSDLQSFVESLEAA